MNTMANKLTETQKYKLYFCASLLLLVLIAAIISSFVQKARLEKEIFPVLKSAVEESGTESENKSSESSDMNEDLLEYFLSYGTDVQSKTDLITAKGRRMKTLSVYPSLKSKDMIEDAGVPKSYQAVAETVMQSRPLGKGEKWNLVESIQNKSYEEFKDTDFDKTLFKDLSYGTANILEIEKDHYILLTGQLINPVTGKTDIFYYQDPESDELISRMSVEDLRLLLEKKGTINYERRKAS